MSEPREDPSAQASEPQAEPPRGAAPERVACRRTGETFDPGTHRRCPYCFGADSDVRPGNHGEFCDFDPQKDPVSFGFPDDTTRHANG